MFVPFFSTTPFVNVFFFFSFFSSLWFLSLSTHHWSLLSPPFTLGGRPTYYFLLFSARTNNFFVNHWRQFRLKWRHLQPTLGHPPFLCSTPSFFPKASTPPSFSLSNPPLSFPFYRGTLSMPPIVTLFLPLPICFLPNDTFPLGNHYFSFSVPFLRRFLDFVVVLPPFYKQPLVWFSLIFLFFPPFFFFRLHSPVPIPDFRFCCLPISSHRSPALFRHPF